MDIKINKKKSLEDVTIVAKRVVAEQNIDRLCPATKHNDGTIDDVLKKYGLE